MRIRKHHDQRGSGVSLFRAGKECNSPRIFGFSPGNHRQDSPRHRTRNSHRPENGARINFPIVRLDLNKLRPTAGTGGTLAYPRASFREFELTFEVRRSCEVVPYKSRNWLSI